MDKTLKIRDWFLENNEELKNNYSDLLLNTLMFYAKAFFTAEENNIVPYNVLMTKEGLLLEGIEAASQNDVSLDRYEIQTLKIINRMYGYINPMIMLDLIYKTAPFINYLQDYMDSYVKISDKEIELTYDNLAYSLENVFNGYNFNEKKIKIKNNYFFMQNDINITQKELESLENEEFDESRTYNIRRDNNGKVVYE